MHFTAAAILASVALVAPAAAAPQSDNQWPSCIQDCVTEFAVSSLCDGDETGEDLANCTCASLSGSLLLDCLHECTPAEQGAYADRVIDGSCSDTIFPDAVYNDDDSNDDDDETNTTAAATTTADTTADPTSSSEEGPTETAEEEDDGSAAMGLDVPAALAVGGLFAAFLL